MDGPHSDSLIRWNETRSSLFCYLVTLAGLALFKRNLCASPIIGALRVERQRFSVVALWVVQKPPGVGAKPQILLCLYGGDPGLGPDISYSRTTRQPAGRQEHQNNFPSDLHCHIPLGGINWALFPSRNQVSEGDNIS